MTDNDIIKALECCEEGAREGYCLLECPRYCQSELLDKDGDCTAELMKSALDLINRQKAEIERLKYNLKAVLEERADHTEAITEFEERLTMHFGTYTDKDCLRVLDMVRLIDQIAKEMKGEQE